MTHNITARIPSPNFESAEPSSPVMVFLHGYGSNERDVAGIASWLDSDLRWVSLHAPFETGNGGFAWFPVTTPLNPSADDVEPSTRAIWSWVDEHLVGSTPLVVISFSQGGLMASQLLRTRPGRTSRTAILAGFISVDSQLGDSQLAQSLPKVLWARGVSDQVVTEDAVNRARVFLSTHSTLTEKVYPGLGHSVDEQVLSDLRDFLGSD